MGGRPYRFVAGVWVGVSAMAGCGNTAPSPGVTVRDSAGIHIIDNVIPAPAPSCPVGAEPITTIGTASGDPTQELYRVFDATRLPDGRIGVLNQGSSELRLYDAAGRFLSAIGRDGEGPGEFRQVRQVLRRADTLLIWDAGLSRWSVVGPNGDFLQTSIIRPSLMNEPWLAGWLDDAGIWAYYRDFQNPTGSAYVQQPLRIFRYGADGVLTDTVATLNGGTLRVVDPVTRMLSGRLFESRAAISATSTHLVVGHGEHAEFQIRNPDWSIHRIVRWTPRDLEVTSEHLSAAREEALNSMEGLPERIRQSAERRFDLIEAADRFPAFAEFLPDELGVIWVRRYPRPGGQTADWMAFGPDGHFVCELTLARPIRAVEFGAGYVLAIWRDADGVERVLQFALDHPVS